MLIPAIGVFFLASGLSALNQFQENRTDALMVRTMNRPIHSSKISNKAGLGISVTLALIGIMILSLLNNPLVILLAIGSGIWYNAFYTPLKKLTPIAVVPGALVGTFPPLIGWVAAGGHIMSLEIWIFSLFIFIWQIPHFWLLLLIYSEDYKNAGFPVLTDIFSDIQLRRITYIWMVSLVASSMMIPIFELNASPVLTGLLGVAGFWLLWRTKSLLDAIGHKALYFSAFHTVNMYVLVAVLLVSIDKLT